jgi:hypothetical protein
MFLYVNKYPLCEKVLLIITINKYTHIVMICGAIISGPRQIANTDVMAKSIGFAYNALIATGFT